MNEEKTKMITKERTQTIIIVLLSLVILVQVYWFFFRSRSKTTNTQSAQTVTTNFPGSDNFNTRDLAIGIIQLKNDQYYSLKDQQKAQLLQYLETYQALQKEEMAAVKEIEKILTKDQLKYIKQNRGTMSGPMMMIDPNKKTTPDRQMVQAIIAQFTGTKQTTQPAVTQPQEMPIQAPEQPKQKGESTNAQ